jgi:sugar-specific transcriptional regulator TrmB
LIKHGELRIQEIATLAKIPRSSVYSSLKALFEFGIAEEIIDQTFKKIRPYPIGAMKHGLDEKIVHLQKLGRDLETLEKSIQIVHEPESKDATTVKFYRGRSGARQLYWNTFRAKNTLYVYSDWGRERYVGKRFYESFVEESRIRKIKERVLINITPEALESIRRFNYPTSPISRTKIEDIRVIEKKDMVIKGDTLMYDNIYAQVYLKNVEINGFEIENAYFAQSQRSIFETLWRLARPVKELV